MITSAATEGMAPVTLWTIREASRGRGLVGPSSRGATPRQAIARDDPSMDWSPGGGTGQRVHAPTDGAPASACPSLDPVFCFARPSPSTRTTNRAPLISSRPATLIRLGWYVSGSRERSGEIGQFVTLITLITTHLVNSPL